MPFFTNRLFRRFSSRLIGAILAVVASVSNAAGLDIETITEGTGALAETGKKVEVHYTGKLTDGSVFDSSLTRGKPFSFTLGEGQVIKGWEEGILGMRVGEKRILTIPPESVISPIPSAKISALESILTILFVDKFADQRS